MESLAELQVEVAVWDGGEAQTSLGGIVEVGAHGREVHERHLGRLFKQLALPGPLCGGRRKGTDGGGSEELGWPVVCKKDETAAYATVQ